MGQLGKILGFPGTSPLDYCFQDQAPDPYFRIFDRWLSGRTASLKTSKERKHCSASGIGHHGLTDSQEMLFEHAPVYCLGCFKQVGDFTSLLVRVKSPFLFHPLQRILNSLVKIPCRLLMFKACHSSFDIDRTGVGEDRVMKTIPSITP